MIYEGSSDINSQPVITFLADQLTSLEATVINNYIVVLTGTADGKIKKVIIKRSFPGRNINKTNGFFSSCSFFRLC